MQRSFRSLYFTALLLLAGSAAWAIWAGDAPATADPVVTAVNAPEPGGLLTFRLDQIPLLQHAFLGQPVWKFIASLIYLVLAFYSSKLVDWIILQRLKRWAEKTETKYDDILIEIVHGPIKVVAFVILLQVGLRLINWGLVFQDYVSKGLRLVVAWSITYMLLKAVDLGLQVWKQRAGADSDELFSEHLFPIIRRSLRVLLIIAAVMLTADNLGLKVTSLLAGLSIGGLALGLAAQDTVANLFGAVAVFLDKPFKVGDRIKVETVDGQVEAIGLRSTRVRNLDGHVVTIPNKTMGNATITNVSLRPNIKTTMALGLTYDTPPAKIRDAKRLLVEIYSRHPMTADLIVGFDKFADFSLNLTVVHWWGATNYKEYVDGMHDLNLEVKERFDAAGINFAFPTQTLYLRQDSASPADRPTA